jgi:hypothetical protein
MAAINTITPTHKLLMNRPVLLVYPNIQGEANVQMANKQLIQLSNPTIVGELSSKAAIIAISAPTIQLL